MKGHKSTHCSARDSSFTVQYPPGLIDDHLKRTYDVALRQTSRRIFL